ncbi:MAG: hypothetical protein ABIS47_10650 [Acidimicrobiales bacterium]
MGLTALGLAAGCGAGAGADTAPVVLAEGVAGGQPWRLEGHRAGGQLCSSLVLVGVDEPPAGRCGLPRTSQRLLDPVTAAFAGRLVVFSALPARARRVRLDGADASLDVEPARAAPGFPGRFFVADLDPATAPVTVRLFAEGGRAVVP